MEADRKEALRLADALEQLHGSRRACAGIQGQMLGQESYFIRGQGHTLESLLDAAALLRRLAELGQWISVAERLPEKYIEVLVAFDGQSLASTGQYTGHPKDKHGWVYPAENFGTNDDGSDPIVTHWMPLPDAPSPKEQS